MTELRLAGCSPSPLSHYLKALGILRLVTEQADSQAKGYWQQEAFVLQSRLDRVALLRFFTSEVCPTPIVGPWAGGCGFFPKDNQNGIGAIRASESPRFAAYRATIAAAIEVLGGLGIKAKPEDKEQKALIIESLRAALPDEAVQWLDSAVALTADGPKYPPLLGTGGNDGHLDFTNNLMQRWAELLLGEVASPAGWLRHALFSDAAADIPVKLAIGQFHPGGAGGANMSSGFDRDSLVNPWNFVLMLEGALLFASSVTRRLEDTRHGALVYPFTVRASGAGYASAALGDEKESRNEIWLPEWSRPSSFNELKCLFAEGRASVRFGKSQRSADNGVDFARALQDLGVQRGVASFTRFGFHKRQGLSYLAVPLGRWSVQRNQAVDILAPLDEWMNKFRGKAAAELAPASARRALSKLETGVLALCTSDTPANHQAVLVALGAAEHALATSKKFTAESFLRPVHGVGRDWLDRANDGSVEWRLAMALAASGLREHLVPVRLGRWAEHDDGGTVWGQGDLVANLLAVARRQSIDRKRGVAAVEPVVFADLADMAAFIEGSVDDGRIVELLRGAALIDLRGVSPHTLRAAAQPTQASSADRRAATPVPYAFAVCALTWHRAVPASAHRQDDLTLPPAPAVLARLIAGDARGAVDAAHRRLHGSGLPLRAGPRTHLALSSALTRRIAAAQLFPLSHSTRRTLAADVIVDENPLVETL